MRPHREHLVRVLLAALAVAPAVLVLLAASFAGEAEHEQAPKKHYYVHRIRLLDAERNPINADSTAPYSPKQTCSSPECHSYEAIAKGMHFDMGKHLMADNWSKGEPWHLSPGMAGGFLPTFRRQFARKKNKSAMPRSPENEPMLEYDCNPNPLREGLLAEPFELEGDAVLIPQAPGLGIEIDPAVLQRYTVTHRESTPN